jgi:hypothetical protein
MSDSKTNTAKLKTLAEIEGMTVDELLEQGTYDSVAKGICMNPGCDYSTGVEPDQDEGWCEVCNTPTVKSALRLAGII